MQFSFVNLRSWSCLLRRMPNQGRKAKSKRSKHQKRKREERYVQIKCLCRLPNRKLRQKYQFHDCSQQKSDRSMLKIVLSLQQIDQDDGVLNFACNFRLQCILNLGLLQIDQVIEYSISLLAFDRSKSVLLTFWMERSTATTLNLITVYTNRQFCQTCFNQLLIHFLSHVPQTKLVAY